MISFADIVISAIPALIGTLIFFAINSKNQRENFDSQVVNIRNGESVNVEFKKDMSKAEIDTVIKALNKITD